MSKKDHDILIQLCQKVDDLSSLLREHIAKEDPIIQLVPTHAERLRWLQRGMIGAFTAVGTLFVGLTAEVLHSVLK